MDKAEPIKTADQADIVEAQMQAWLELLPEILKQVQESLDGYREFKITKADANAIYQIKHSLYTLFLALNGKHSVFPAIVFDVTKRIATHVIVELCDDITYVALREFPI